MLRFGHGSHGILLPEHMYQFTRSVAQLFTHHHGSGERHRVFVRDGHPVRCGNSHAERMYNIHILNQYTTATTQTHTVQRVNFF